MDNTAGFMIVGYVITWIALAWYVQRLTRRSRAAKEVIEISVKIREDNGS
jgi:hypothetical protein